MGWFGHYLALIGYTLLSAVMAPLEAVMPRGMKRGFKVGDKGGLGIQVHDGCPPARTRLADRSHDLKLLPVTLLWSTLDPD